LAGIRELTIKGNISRVISCGHEGDNAIFIFMIFMTKLEVLVEFLLIDFVIVHDLEELSKLFDEVIISRFLEFLNSSKARRKKPSRIYHGTPQR
jgi:hypothetical protein